MVRERGKVFFSPTIDHGMAYIGGGNGTIMMVLNHEFVDQVQQLHYKRYQANVSDHRPISAAFSVTVKNFDHEARENWKALLQNQWLERQEGLVVAREFYVRQVGLSGNDNAGAFSF